jgi:heme exporter protein CcmD
MREFLEMSGYWPFVWSAYGIAVGALVLNAWQARRLLARARNEARRRLAAQES